MIRSSARRKRDVDIFNFSFLDILACVIGLLIFVLTIVVVSGNGSSATAAAATNAADHQFHEAKVAASIAADQRLRLEQILSQHAQDVTDASQDSSIVRRQIAAMNEEKLQFDAQTILAEHKLGELQVTLAGTTTSFPKGRAPELAEEAAKLRSLTMLIEKQVTEAGHQSTPRTVSYYLPHVQETNRRTLWVEISGDRLWVVESDDYRQTSLNADSTRYERHDGAVGLSISALASAHPSLPIQLAAASPEETVIEAVVRPDGFESYRKLRDWAWQHGFAVNWAPVSPGPIVLTTVSHAYQQ